MMTCQLKRCDVVYMYPLYEGSLGLKKLLSFVSEGIIWILTLVRERATYYVISYASAKYS